jgi:tetratricopeptide (TPR) repeat protein
MFSSRIAQFAAWILVLVLTGWLCVPRAMLAADQESESIIARAEQELKHAETYYWFGLAEQGNLMPFRHGLHHLDRASDLVDTGPLSEADKKNFHARVDGLRTDLEEQVEIAHDTLFGLFPITRFLARSIFAESTSLNTFELIDDPTVMASTAAARRLALETIERWTQRHQLDVVFTSLPHNTQLENEALYVFNSHSKFYVHNLREVVDALRDVQLAQFQSGHVTPDIRDSLMNAFGISDLLVVVVREADVIDDNYFYILEAAIYREQQGSPTHTFAVMGFSRDRTHQLMPILWVNLLMLGLAYLAFALQTQIRQRAAVRASPFTFVVLPLVTFAVGRCTPWFLAPLLASISPVPETLAIVSFWVPCLAGAALTVLPMASFWIVSKRLARFWPMFNIDSRAAAVCVGIGVGAAAYLATPLFLYLQRDALHVLLPLTIGFAGIGYLLGRALDSVDRTSRAVAFLPLLLSIILGAAIFHGLPSVVWTVTCVVGLACMAPLAVDVQNWLVLAKRQPRGIKAISAESTAAGDRPAAEVGRLVQRIENPDFQRFAAYRSCWQLVQPVCGGRTAHLTLYGVGGCGLSATARQIVERLRRAIEDEGRQAVVMCGECSRAVGEPTPYGPFQKALASHFEIELLASPDARSSELDTALGDVFQSVLPFSGILFPSVGDTTTRATSTGEIASSIAWMLRRLCKKKSVIVLIDDAQWLDDASRALLQHLLGEFPVGGTEPIAFVVTSHEQKSLDALGSSPSTQVELPFPSQRETTQILTRSIGLAPSAAEQVVTQLGATAVSRGGLFWIQQVVASLARAGVFVEGEDGFELRGGKWPRDVQIPKEMRDVFTDQLRQFPQYRMIFECAACAADAREFQATAVARVLGVPRLQLLADLDRIDRETSILYDVCERDDAFAFQSSFMLDVVRDELRIVEVGPASGDVAQIVREYHARLGMALEDSLEKSPKQIYAVANHYYAAGASYADRGVKYCLEAARAAAAILDFDTAENYLQRADECAQVSGDVAAVEAERLDISCRQAHLSGGLKDLTELAERGAAYLRRTPECGPRLRLSIAQVHYDAGKQSGERSWFDRSLEIGSEIIARASSAQDEAIGRHFVGISLPRTRREERRQQLRSALRLMDTDDVGDYALLGRIMGALAEELSRGSADDRREAKALFERRLRLNETHGVGDPRGEAMTHGGLGRLAFYYEPRNIRVAKHHFQKDLDIAEAIGDQQGQVQMHSLLGACALEEDHLDLATDHYQRSWELSRGCIDQFFAGVGLLTCHVQKEQPVEFQGVVERLLALADEGIPDICADDLVAALTACPSSMANFETKRLLELAEIVANRK